MNHPHTKGHGHPGNNASHDTLRLVAWETTRSCNLSCVHCRAAADNGPYEGELDTQAAFTLLDQITKVGNPIIILTGGEPLMRPDIFEIATYGTQKGLRMVMAVNGTLVTRDNAQKMVDSGIKRISVSLDGADKTFHDQFRGVDGAFDGAMEGIGHAKAVGLEFQINTTITKANLDQIPKILETAENMGAVAHHIFLLVPTGRGKYMLDQEITAKEYEKTLNWFYDQREKTSLQLKATCAPHYYRILRQRAKEEGKKISFDTHGLDAVTRGCLGGIGFCFISHTGVVQPCGYLHTDCGNVTKQPFDEIWKNSEKFLTLRNYDLLDGKCGPCEYKKVCGGCRARAFEATGDFMAEEPLCTYVPHSMG
ncbi:MAG: heme b synthase [Proteobacteria bacterium]|nr:heme b synthase [Pseudomonadota bacterium]